MVSAQKLPADLQAMINTGIEIFGTDRETIADKIYWALNEMQEDSIPDDDYGLHVIGEYLTDVLCTEELNGNKQTYIDRFILKYKLEKIHLSLKVT